MGLPSAHKETEQVTPVKPGEAYSNGALITGLKERTPAVCAAFFDRFQRHINMMVWKLLGEDGEHDDVVNNIYADILSSVGSIVSPEALPAWVSQVCVNAVRRELRSRKYRRLFTPIVESPPEMAWSRNREQDRVVGRIFAAISGMSPENHIVFVLRFVEGHTFEEIAALQGCSLATAKRRGKKCRTAFMKRARRDPLLRELVAGVDTGVDDE